jgi:hypothetical protein
MKSNDLKLLEEAYLEIIEKSLFYESAREPVYLGAEKDKERWMKWLSKLKHEIHENGSISVKTDVDLNSKRMYGRLPFNFNRIHGDFVCIASDLETLEGAPRYVASSFSCAHTKITSLKGAPNYVGDEFNCHGCKITSLEGCPEIIKGEFSHDNFCDKDYRDYIKFHNLRNKYPELEEIF